MEDSFRVRVDKAFGNLSSNDSSSVAVTPSLWTLTDEEIEKRVWNRNKQVEEEEEILKTGPRNNLDSDLNELSDDDEDEDEDDRDEIDAEEKIRHHNISGGVDEYFDVLSSIGRDCSLDFKRNMAADDEEEEEVEQIDGGKKKRRQNSSGNAEADEYLDVQSNIGRDCTLDYEEEEDEYDKVAVGMEQSDDRVYMRNVKYADYSVDEVNGYGELPDTFQNVVRDPRANHWAAKIRLKEDAESAGFGTLQLSDHPITTNSGSNDLRKGESDIDNPKPILKKKENPESRSQKRVRFVVDPSSIHQGQQSSGASDAASEPNVRDDSAVSVQESDSSLHSVGVPDYLRNPSKYRRYTFGSTDDVDEESNRKACMDFFDNLRRRSTDTLMEDTSMEIPKSIVFTPKKKPEQDSTEKRGEGEHKTRGNQENKSWSFGITAEDTQESEVSAMEEDEPASAGEHSSRKSGRQYRTRTNIDIDDIVDRV